MDNELFVMLEEFFAWFKVLVNKLIELFKDTKKFKEDWETTTTEAAAG